MVKSELCVCCFERDCFGCHAGDQNWEPADCFGQPLTEKEDDDGESV